MRRSHYPTLSLLLVVIVVFFPVCGYDFLNYDDNVNVYNNGLVRHPTFDSFLQFWRAPYAGLYIPVTYSLWALLAKLAALFPLTASNHINPAVFHAANLLTHALSTLVLFRILRLLVPDDWAAAAGALLFAVHPVQVEAVAWVTGMKDLLSGFMALLSLWQYLLTLGTGDLSRRRRAIHYALAIVFFLAAMLAKPGAVVVPLVAGLLGHLLLQRTGAQLLPTLLPLLLLAIPVVIVTKVSQPGTQEFLPALWQRFFIVGDALSFYLGKLLLPVGLGPDYGRTPAYVLSQGRVYIIGLIPYLLLGVWLWKFRQPWAMAAAGVFIAVLLPVLGFLSFDFQIISTVSDRYLYLALLGPALGVDWLLARYPVKEVRIGVGVVFLLLAGQSVVTVSHWRDSLAIYPHAIKVNPRSWIVPNIMAEAEIDRQHYAEAVAAGKKSIAANPSAGGSYYNLGLALQGLNRPEEADAAYRKAVELRPTFLPAYNNLAVLNIDLGKIEEAEALLQKAMEIYRSGNALRTDEGLLKSRAILYNTLGRLHGAQNQLDQAIEAFRQAVAADPYFPEAYNNLGSVYLATNRYPEAMEAYQQAVIMLPAMAAFHNNLCNVYNLLNRNEEALVSCQTAMGLDPLYADPYLNFGNAMMANNRHEEAVGAYRKALELAPQFDRAAFNLAMVYESLGNTSEAATFFQRAIAIRPDFVEAHDALGRVYQQLGMVPEAQAEFNKVLELNPNFGGGGK